MSRGWGWGRKKGCNTFAGGSPGLLINKLVSCSPRLASDSHCPQSSLICLSCLYTQIVCVGCLLDCVFFHFILCCACRLTHTRTSSKIRHKWISSWIAHGDGFGAGILYCCYDERRGEKTKTPYIFSLYKCTFVFFCFPVFPCVPEKPGMPCPGEDSKFTFLFFSFTLSTLVLKSTCVTNVMYCTVSYQFKTFRTQETVVQL